MARPKSILLFGEGKTDAVFLAHLCHIYRSPAAFTKVEHGKGGSDQTVVQAAIKIARLADYSGVLVLLDSDRDDGPIPADWCKKNRLLIKRASPCLESLLLEILGDPKLSKLTNGARASDRCKAHFHATYLATDRSGQVLGRLKNCLRAKFSKKVLDDARSRIPVFGEIIAAIEGQLD